MLINTWFLSKNLIILSFCYKITFTDTWLIFRLKDIGQTVGGHKGPADAVTLASQKFEIGDFMDIAIMLPRENRRY